MKTRPITHTLAPAIILGLLFFACTKSETEQSAGSAGPGLADGTVVATVNGDPITLGEFQERFARAGFKQGGDIPEVKEEFLHRLVERKMMLREAQRKRIKIGLPEINQRLDAFKKEHGKDVKEELAAQGVELAPVLRRLEPRFERAFARAADLLRDDERALAKRARMLLEEDGSAEIAALLGEPRAVRRRLVRALFSGGSGARP